MSAMAELLILAAVGLFGCRLAAAAGTDGVRGQTRDVALLAKHHGDSSSICEHTDWRKKALKVWIQFVPVGDPGCW